MNDFDYDVYQRKRIARGASARKCGSKSKKCYLPSDRLTPKQWRERNGKVMEYNLNKPVNWTEFTSYPRDIQEEYLKKLIWEYNAKGSNLAHMFNIDPSTFSKYVKYNQFDIKFVPGKRMSSSEREKWSEFIGEEEAKPEPMVEAENPETSVVYIEKPFEDCPCEEEPETVVERPVGNSYMSNFSISFEGELDVNMIANSLKSILGVGSRGTIDIVFQRKV